MCLKNKIILKKKKKQIQQKTRKLTCDTVLTKIQILIKFHSHKNMMPQLHLKYILKLWASLISQLVKNPPAMQETPV